MWYQKFLSLNIYSDVPYESPGRREVPWERANSSLPIQAPPGLDVLDGMRWNLPTTVSGHQLSVVMVAHFCESTKNH